LNVGGLNMQEVEMAKSQAAVEAKSAMLRSEGSPQFINFINMEVRHPNDEDKKAPIYTSVGDRSS